MAATTPSGTPGFIISTMTRWEIGGWRVYGAEWCSDFPGRPAPSLLPHDDRGFPGDAGLGHLRPRGGIQADKRRHRRAGGKVDVVITHFPPTLGALDHEQHEEHRLIRISINDNEALVRLVDARALGVGPHALPVRLQGGAHTGDRQSTGLPLRPGAPGVLRDEDGGGERTMTDKEYAEMPAGPLSGGPCCAWISDGVSSPVGQDNRYDPACADSRVCVCPRAWQRHTGATGAAHLDRRAGAGLRALRLGVDLAGACWAFLPSARALTARWTGPT